MTEYSYNKKENTTHICLGLFKDQSSRLESIKNNCFEPESFMFSGLLTETECFGKIKETEFFAGAEDC